MFQAASKQDQLRKILPLLVFVFVLLLAGCSKEQQFRQDEVLQPTLFTRNTIFKGNHFSNQSNIKAFSGNSISVNVRFDSSAIYQTTNIENQEDINKLVGFSEGFNNHLNSARIGWNWSKNALKLYAYAYINGQRVAQEIAIINIGDTVRCNISVTSTKYVFVVGDKLIELPRAPGASKVSGYWQYSYFGGDEVAPHNIYIDIEYL